MSEARRPEHTIVLVALDRPEAVATLLPAARMLAEQLGAEVEALHVSARPLDEPALRHELGLGDDAQGVKISMEVGDAVERILRHAQRGDVEIVALATRSRSPDPEKLLGSVAEGVIAAIERPLLVVRPEVAARRVRPFKRLLLPLDATPTTAAALKEVLDLVARLEASIDVLYVIAQRPAEQKERGSMRAPKYVDQPQHEWPSWADEVMNRFLSICGECPAEIPVTVHVRQGEIGSEIARFAAARHHDAIVLVRRSHLEPGRAHALRAVLQHAPCPIFLVGTNVAPRTGSRRVTISADDFDAVIMDMDGVVTRTAALHAEAWKAVFDAYLKAREVRGEGRYAPFDLIDDYRRHVDGKPRYAGVASFLAARGIAIPYGDPSDSPRRETICGLGNRKNEAFRRLLRRRGVAVFDSTLRLVRDLRSLGLKIGIFSASRNCHQVLAAAGIEELFDARVDGVVAAELGLPGKPRPETLLELARRLGAAPRRTVVIEDAIAGVQAGAAGPFGLVIGVNRSGPPDELASHGADVEVDDLAAVTGVAARSTSVPGRS